MSAAVPVSVVVIRSLLTDFWLNLMAMYANMWARLHMDLGSTCSFKEEVEEVGSKLLVWQESGEYVDDCRVKVSRRAGWNSRNTQSDSFHSGVH